MTTHAKEDRFLLARVSGDSIAALTGALDWEYLASRAVREGVFYPFYKNLAAADEKERIIPDGCREKLRALWYGHLSAGAAYAAAVDRLLGRLDLLEIRALVFKGPAVDERIYDGYVRPRLDVDIAVKDEDVPAMERALSAMGYAPEGRDPGALTPEYLNSKIFKDGNGVSPAVHLHHRLINNMFLTVDAAGCAPRPDMDTVWRETEPFGSYRHIVTLRPELAVVYLCEHGLKHDFDQLVYLYEIDRLVSSSGGRLDRRKVIALAGECGLDRIVYHGLYLVREVFGAAIPDGVLDALKPSALSGGERLFIEGVSAKYKGTVLRKRTVPLYRRYASYPVYLALREGPLRKARFVFLTLFPPGFTLAGYWKRSLRFVKYGIASLRSQ